MRHIKDDADDPTGPEHRKDLDEMLLLHRDKDIDDIVRWLRNE